MPNQLSAVLSTYATRRSVQILGALGVAYCVLVFFAALADSRQGASVDEGVLGMLTFPTFAFAYLIASQARWQFADPRARLVPHFAANHVAVLAGLAILSLGLAPALLGWAAGASVLGSAAASIAIGASLIWLIQGKNAQALLFGFGTFAIMLRPGILFWLTPETASSNWPYRLALCVAGWAAFGGWLVRLANLREEQADYPQPIFIPTGFATRLERMQASRGAARLYPNDTSVSTPWELGDKWRDSLPYTRGTTIPERRQLLQFGFAASPSLIQAILITSLFASMFYGVHYFLLPGKAAWPTILPSLGMITLYPSLNVLGVLATRRPRIAQELLLPLTRRDYVDGLLIAGARRTATMAICSTLAGLGLLAVASPQQVSVQFVFLYAFLAFAIQLWAFGAYAYTAQRSSGLRVLIIVGLVVPIAMAAFWGLRSAADGPVPMIPRPDFASRPTLPPEALARLEALHQKQTAEIREQQRARPERSLAIATAIGLGGAALIAHSRRRWMQAEFGALPA
jgi:hypothetical protein